MRQKNKNRGRKVFIFLSHIFLSGLFGAKSGLNTKFISGADPETGKPDCESPPGNHAPRRGKRRPVDLPPQRFSRKWFLHYQRNRAHPKLQSSNRRFGNLPIANCMAARIFSRAIRHSARVRMLAGSTLSWASENAGWRNTPAIEVKKSRRVISVIRFGPSVSGIIIAASRNFIE